jgi:hypothetical protein
MRESSVEKVTAALIQHGSMRKGPNWNCPTSNHANGDRNQSLTVSFNGAGVGLYCHMGCGANEIVTAIGLNMTDLFEGEDGQKTEVARYTYQDSEGQVLFAKIRYSPKGFSVEHPNGNGWQAGLGNTRRVLYRLPEVRRAIAEGQPIYLVEGEKDVDRLRREGVTATCNFDGASLPGVKPKWRPEYSDMLAGADVVIVADRDPAGYAHAQAAAESLRGRARSIRTMQAAVDGHGADVSDHLDAGYKITDLVSLDNELSRLYTPINWREAWDRTTDEVDWLFPPILEVGTVNALYGRPGVGKSLITLEMVLEVVRAGHRVLYLDDENRVEDTVERLKNFGAKADELDRLYLYNFAGLPPLDTPEGGRHLVAIVDKHEPALVVLDTTTRMVEGDENSSNTFLQLYRCTLVPLKNRRITVLRLDHPGKDDRLGQRGSSAKHGDVDTVWRLAAEEGDMLVLERTKSRSGHGEAFIHIRRIQKPLLHHDWTALDKMPVSAKVMEWAKNFDRWKVPLNAGRPRLREELNMRDPDCGVSTTVLALVAKYRKTIYEYQEDTTGQVPFPEPPF